MAKTLCSQCFHVEHLTPDETRFGQAFRDLMQLQKGGVIEGPFIVHVGERHDVGQLIISVWRPRRIVPDEGWNYAVDAEGSEGLVHRYTKVFNLAAAPQSEIVYAVQQLLFCPFEGPTPHVTRTRSDE